MFSDHQQLAGTSEVRSEGIRLNEIRVEESYSSGAALRDSEARPELNQAGRIVQTIHEHIRYRTVRVIRPLLWRRKHLTSSQEAQGEKHQEPRPQVS
jgi:hypothetical protein